MRDFQNQEHRFRFSRSWKRCGINEEEDGKTKIEKCYVSEVNVKNP